MNPEPEINLSQQMEKTVARSGCCLLGCMGVLFFVVLAVTLALTR